MATGNLSEKPSRKRRSLFGILITVILNIFLMSVLAWFLLLVGFGCYRLTGSNVAVYHDLKVIAQPNVDFVQRSQFFRMENDFLEKRFRKILHPGINVLPEELEEAKNQWSTVGDLIQRYLNKFKKEIVPLIYGVTAVVVTRVLDFCLATPLFLLCLSLGFVDGLVQRDIRRFQCARESALLFHELKRTGACCFYIPLFVYLALPFPVSPLWFLVPMAVVLGVLLQLCTKSFKKYI